MFVCLSSVAGRRDIVVVVVVAHRQGSITIVSSASAGSFDSFMATAAKPMLPPLFHLLLSVPIFCLSLSVLFCSVLCSFIIVKPLLCSVMMMMMTGGGRQKDPPPSSLLQYRSVDVVVVVVHERGDGMGVLFFYVHAFVSF